MCINVYVYVYMYIYIYIYIYILFYYCSIIKRIINVKGYQENNKY